MRVAAAGQLGEVPTADDAAIRKRLCNAALSQRAYPFAERGDFHLETCDYAMVLAGQLCQAQSPGKTSRSRVFPDILHAGTRPAMR